MEHPSSERGERHSKISEIVKKVDHNASFSQAEFEQAIDLLEAFECWTAYFKLLNKKVSDASQRRLEHYVRIAKTYHQQLEDIGRAADVCASLVKDLKISYQTLQQDVITRILGVEEFAAEAVLLNCVVPYFTATHDQVKCLERLCIIYEKKTHNEGLLAKTYEQLIETDPKNLKALRYFKLVFTQSSDWDEVVLILKTLLISVTHPQEVYRVALELAAVYLYQLDNPNEAIAVLESRCIESPIDTSTVFYDAYQRLGHLEGCLRVLRQCLLSVEGDSGRAIIRFKMGQIYQQTGDQAQALDNFQRAFKLWPSLLDAAESVIHIAVANKDWHMVQQYLGLLRDGVVDEVLKSQITQVERRLSDGLSYGSK